MGLGIDLIELAAGRTEPLDPAQTLLAGGEERGAAGALGELADRLSNRLGASRVTRLLSRPSHIPERAQALAPVLGGIPDGSGPPPITAARPPLLLASPEPVEVVAEVPDGPPVRLLWRRKSRRIVRAEGPERIAHEWWRPFLGLAPASPALERARDYYRIEDEEGGRYWVFRAGLYGEGAETPAPAWYLHGLYG
jgi:protein ImuB